MNRQQLNTFFRRLSSAVEVANSASDMAEQGCLKMFWDDEGNPAWNDAIDSGRVAMEELRSLRAMPDIDRDLILQAAIDGGLSDPCGLKLGVTAVTVADRMITCVYQTVETICSRSTLLFDPETSADGYSIIVGEIERKLPYVDAVLLQDELEKLRGAVLNRLPPDEESTPPKPPSQTDKQSYFAFGVAKNYLIKNGNKAPTYQDAFCLLQTVTGEELLKEPELESDMKGFELQKTLTAFERAAQRGAKALQETD